MYSQVPPPHQLCDVPSTSTTRSEGVAPDYSKPDNVSDCHWKKFQELKARRERECGKATEKRKAAIKHKALKAVTKELSSADRAILEDDGVSLSSRHRRKRKCDLPKDGDAEVTSCGKAGAASIHTVSGTHSEQWEEMKQYFDPNPQLKGVEQGRYAVKSKLEERMDLAIEQRQFEDAVMMSEKLSQREFASKLAAAFDCQDFVKRKKLEEERRRARKQKLKWRFEHKQRWEMKGNM